MRIAKANIKINKGLCFPSFRLAHALRSGWLKKEHRRHEKGDKRFPSPQQVWLSCIFFALGKKMSSIRKPGNRDTANRDTGNRNSGNRNTSPIRIGLVADEPIRLAGLTSVFEQAVQVVHGQLLPIIGSMTELLEAESLQYLVVDLHISTFGLETLDTIRRARPDIKLIVIGPGGNDDLALNAIAAGARAYLDHEAGPEAVLTAIEQVTEGSIWAPRRLLSKLIDRLLESPDAREAVIGPAQIRPAEIPPPPMAPLETTPLQTEPLERAPQLTARERQVLELILKAHSNREIASELGIEERTVRAHLARLMRKTGADNRIKLSISARSLFSVAVEE
jgi:DNA-binding NarL/FixJ family response regulator